MAEVPPPSVVSETPNPKAYEPEAPNPKAESATPTPEEKLPATTPVPAVEPEPHLGLVKVTLPGGKEIYVPQESIQMPPTQPETGHKRTAPSLGPQTSDIKEEAVEFGDMDPAARCTHSKGKTLRHQTLLKVGPIGRADSRYGSGGSQPSKF